MAERIIITCDNCQQEEPFHARVRSFALTGWRDPIEPRHLCGHCANKVAQTLTDIRIEQNVTYPTANATEETT